MSRTSYQLHDNVAVIGLDDPPINALGHAMRGEIVAAVVQGLADPAVQAIVLIGSERLFSGGADIREFNTPAMFAEPSLATMIATMEDAGKPVIVAIAGTCMGGGLELALGCHYRVAKSGAQIALPEVKIGLLPGAGGTQRLPRLIGVEAALNVIVSGATVPVEQFKGSALFDAIVDGPLLEGTLAFAQSVLAQAAPLKRVRDLKVGHPKADALFLFARNSIGAVTQHYPAPLKCVDAIEAAVKRRFDEGLAYERELFAQLMMSEASNALRHVFFAERAASKIADVPADTPTRNIVRVGVVGGGTMGSGIAINFLNAGLPVVLLETSAAALERGVASIRKVLEGAVAKGKSTQEKATHRFALLQPTLDYAGFADADLVIEAVYEEMGVKQTVFQHLDAVCKPGAILASNTSTLDLNRIAAFTARPQDVIGAHFFSPAHVMPLLEVIRGEHTGKDVLATVMQLAKRIKKTAVVSGVCDGFIGNRMINMYSRAAMALLEEGASPQQLDAAMEAFGMAMGPCHMADLAGGDIGWAVRKRQYAEHPTMKHQVIADRLCELGRFGQKAGAGFYRYEPGRRDALADPEVDALIAAYRQEAGITPRKIPASEIVERCVYALVNEAARLLDEGIAQRASDVDVVYLMGYGFPPYRGGPMLYADRVGLANVLRAIKRFAAAPRAEPGFWEPAPLLARLADAGASFH
ncbi:3-hydroxyacyl-CoA dehydrogenase NAD-binding domain-containing protein [Dyella silvatica]|uniref:3-hydroxyacyl-CoA dehydrogenase NAD-binding domain-containing protein n=1 Tax=Dyella silvatica TaxID=2992128 RepID=UPI00225807BD|nr:3-hydroxyacyl-CoA dehydrogenase NAD-binding domain-containing protein [Dyella silvatica]